MTIQRYSHGEDDYSITVEQTTSKNKNNNNDNEDSVLQLLLTLRWCDEHFRV